MESSRILTGEEFKAEFFTPVEEKDWHPGGSSYEEPSSEDYEAEKIEKNPSSASESVSSSESLVPEEFATQIVELTEAGLFMGGEFLSKKRLFSSEEEFEEARQIYEAYKKRIRELPDESRRLFRKYATWRNYNNDVLPFDEKEKSKLKKNLSLLLKKKNVRLSPEWALLFAAAMILGSRFVALQMLKSE